MLIDKENSVALPLMGKIRGGLRIGIRIRSTQTIKLLTIYGKDSHGKRQSLSATQRSPLIRSSQSSRIYPARPQYDRCVGCTAIYTPDTHGGGPVDTQLS